jgi:hypothetical protein
VLCTLVIVLPQIYPMRGNSGTLGFDLMRTNRERTEDPTPDPTQYEQRTNRVTVADAAQLLNLSAEAVRMRIKRGTLASEKVGGTVYVLLESNQTRTKPTQTGDQTTDQTDVLTADQTALVDALQAEVQFLREELQRREEVHAEENRRKDTIIAQLTQRIPELEASAEPRESPGEGPESAAEGSSRPTQPQETAQRRSWLYRFFFGP